ncbi:MAG: TonB-dependent receptor [Chitinophagaceae bacterium]|nr:TonB-dependent receptor [Chitinophagaceae bacterium]
MLSRFLVSSLFISQVSFGQSSQSDTSKPGIFELGEVVIVSSKNNEINAVVDSRDLEQFATTNVSKALDLLPGVNLSAVGPRNEAMVYVRGFDLRQVPLQIDGIPVYIPYDGYVDLARFTTFDLAQVQVFKGYTSVVYGPNALGGAINLISRKPVKKFELSGASGWLSGGYRTNVNVGSNLGNFYIQAGASKLKRDYFPLSKKFTPSKNEDGGDRDNSWNSDGKYNIKIALTPNNKSEYALSYIYQHGKKGTPVYSGSDTLNSQFKNPRFWQWPYWDKQSLYFISKTAIDSSQYFKTRLYYDKFKNLLNSYDDATFSTITRPFAFKSYYDDYTLGGIVEYGKILSARDNLTATAQYKYDVHREHNEGEPERTMSDKTFTAGIENEFKLSPNVLLLTGIAFHNRSSGKAQDYNSNTKEVTNHASNGNSAYNLQGGLEYRLNNVNLLNLSVARKTRFATTKDRYSYRLGTAIPNPDLKAEYALNYELGYKGTLSSKITLQAALFYSKINQTIQMVSNVKFDSTRNAWQSQLQNVGKSEYLGGEAGIRYQVTPAIESGLNYTYIRRKNLANPDLKFIDVPRHKLFAFVQYEIKEGISFQVNANYNSKRYSTTYGAVAGSFVVMNASARIHVWRWFSVEGGIYNIADKNYALVEGYAEAGRNYFANIIYRL